MGLVKYLPWHGFSISWFFFSNLLFKYESLIVSVQKEGSTSANCHANSKSHDFEYIFWFHVTPWIKFLRIKRINIFLHLAWSVRYAIKSFPRRSWLSCNTVIFLPYLLNLFNLTLLVASSCKITAEQVQPRDKIEVPFYFQIVLK